MTALPPNLLTYDEDFRERLAAALLETVFTLSRSDNVVCLRLHEIREAVADTLAEMLALEGTIPDRRLIESHARRIRHRLAAHRRNPAVAKFKARVIRINVGRKGSAS
jgi:hypothetical protein